MSDVRNPELYRALLSHFGKVVVANRGCPSYLAYNFYKGRMFPDPKGGEYYRVNCPVCREHRQRLWVNHLFGTRDKHGTQMMGCAVCFNCGAHPGDAYLADRMRPSFAKFGLLTIPTDETEHVGLAPVERPEGDFSAISDLTSDHIARAYLDGRGFDAAELDAAGWLFCQRSDFLNLCRRIYIPILHEFQAGDPPLTAGWQARAISGYSARSEPKYYTMPGFHKSQAIYNLYRARHFPLVVVTEGVTDAMRVGPHAVSLMGKSASHSQLRLLTSQCVNSRLAVMLDLDAYSHGWRLAQTLNTASFSSRCLKRGAFAVRLPAGDPGSYTREQLSSFIAQADKDDDSCLPKKT